MIKVSAPGKLIMAGEWAVLEKGNPAIVAAINRSVFVEIYESKETVIDICIEDFKIKNFKAAFKNNQLTFLKRLCQEEIKQLSIVKSTIETVLNYINNYKPFKIKTYSQETIINGDKIGFGSSAAASVAIVSALLRFYGIGTSKERIFKLAAISHYLAQSKIGSGVDVAASTYGSIIIYKRFDDKWLLKQIDGKKSLNEIVEVKWPELCVEQLKIPKDFNLLVGWTGESASTSDMVKRMYGWKKRNREGYFRIINNISGLVKELLKNFKEDNKEKIIELLRKNESYLRELGQKSGVNIETEKLRELSEIADNNGGAGKLSGAGGGDCGIAIVFNKEKAEKIKKEWIEKGIKLINVELA
ncbi:phosphomevalonate kinase [Candidatus Woesearchaeota archaeon]|nr:phosphomevalonate kinase [Candidatus Woesearchaeota archaeon]